MMAIKPAITLSANHHHQLGVTSQEKLPNSLKEARRECGKHLLRLQSVLSSLN